jgi:hypothetical protein
MTQSGNAIADGNSLYPLYPRLRIAYPRLRIAILTSTDDRPPVLVRGEDFALVGQLKLTV